jgi:hypothetical protein
MNVRLKMRISSTAPLVLLITLLAASQMLLAQAAARLVGSITGLDAATLTIKTDAGEVHKVVVPASAILKRIAPGQRDLSTADTLQFSDLALGDRVLVKLDPEAPAGTEQALQIIAVKQADLAAKQKKDAEDWQRRGIGGLVKSVDAPNGAIIITTGAGPTAKSVTVHTTKTTILKRYAPASVRYEAALLAPIDAIHAGDQLRAKGTKSADGAEFAAEEVVSGSFRNISATVLSVDAAASTITVKDLATKKQVTIHTTADAQLRRIPDMMAQMLARRLKGGQGGFGVANGNWSGGQSGAASRPAGAGNGQWAGGGQGGGDPQQFLSRAPVIQLADLKKGEAIMVVATQADSDVTAITLLAGVEPLLEAPAVQNLLSNWSVGGGSAGGEGSQ